jgi:ribosomal RNA-processing protein 17
LERRPSEFALSMGPPTKRRKKDSNAVEEVVFDASARADYLTGFHKRKLQRIKRAREEAAKREKAEKVTERKRVGIP